MYIYTKLENLEKLIESLIETINNSKFYTDSDIAGVRQNVEEVDKKITESVYPSWIPKGYEYFTGERVSYNDFFYRCIQNHISQEDWVPGLAVSLWAEIPGPAEEWPEWKQPAGAHDTYSKGDKVSHNDKHWISEIDNNAYEPGVYGWAEA